MKNVLLILVSYGLIRAGERADVVQAQWLDAVKKCQREIMFCFVGGAAPRSLHPYPTPREREIVEWLQQSQLKEVQLTQELNLEPEEFMALTTDIFPILTKNESINKVVKAESPLDAHCTVLFKGIYVIIKRCPSY